MAWFLRIFPAELLLVLGAAAVGLVLLWGWGAYRYEKGIEDATRAFLEADLEGARSARETAREVLSRIGDDPDVDELLRSTGGLRD